MTIATERACMHVVLFAAGFSMHLCRVVLWLNACIRANLHVIEHNFKMQAGHGRTCLLYQL